MRTGCDIFFLVKFSEYFPLAFHYQRHSFLLRVPCRRSDHIFTYRLSSLVLRNGGKEGVIVEFSRIVADVSMNAMLNEVLHQLVIAFFRVAQRLLLQKGCHFRIGHFGSVACPLTRQRRMSCWSAFASARWREQTRRSRRT